ncbi:menaquinol-cytochrome c reductase (cytochrome b/c subunit) [Caldalkalibacillus thermarum TA2.A1]|uniref:C-type cytochrome n=1 Tax=Caldalkalibacillus thermarum (strain TA2.A1) TaxID=986075 RepID=F5L8X4_CALTT|nr:menaquinol-cytochrome c reductase cytochrome b/c subunit [Caldalkalibacillus thermarum]EGL82256.1 menaquinol-cytochrome c reductase (cytochrome b/c subunit) [Caldalkalibacillus thermarum TA2.A1]QZT32731.1 c-type cytochrome [Caldalkalibacillus thermarum TA2.A1]
MASNHDNHHKDVKYVEDSRILARRVPNIPKDYSEYPGKTEPFWPNFLLKEWMVGAVVLIGFLVLTVAHEPPLERLADPTDTGYAPVPDWYFLFLYELLKYTYASGPYTVIGTVAIPGLAFAALLLAPWLDRSKERRPVKRPIATSIMLLVIASIFVLTYDAYKAHDWSQNEVYAWDSPYFDVEIDTSHPAYELYVQYTCINCHGENLEGGAAGVPLNLIGSELNKDEIKEVIINGQGSMPGGLVTDEEDLEALAEWLASLDGEDE